MTELNTTPQLAKESITTADLPRVTEPSLVLAAAAQALANAKSPEQVSAYKAIIKIAENIINEEFESVTVRIHKKHKEPKPYPEIKPFRF